MGTKVGKRNIQGSTMALDPPASQSAQSGGGDVVTHETENIAITTMASAMRRVGGKGGCATGDIGARKVIAAESTVASIRRPPPEAGDFEAACAAGAVDRPRLPVDFNEMLEQDLVLLSQADAKRDSSGTLIELSAGLRVRLSQDDTDEDGSADNLIADGIVELHPGGTWGHVAKWCCRIDERGIRHESDGD